MSVPLPLRNLLAWWVGSLLLWGLITIAFASQLVFASSADWGGALTVSFREWVPWAILTPLVVGLTVRFPFERGRWWWSLPIHLLGCCLVVVSSGLLSQALGGREMGPPVPPWRRGQAGQAEGRDGGPFGPREGRPLREGQGGLAGNRLDRLPQGMRTPLLMRARLNVPVYWIVVSATAAVLHSRRARERERRSLELAASLARSRLATLRAQLQPHFLFNALNAISTLVHRDPRAADEMIANLSDFLRLTLDQGEAQEVELGRELELVRRYLSIEQVRFGDRLTVTVDCPAETLGLAVPVLILQPLVENALKHGLQPKRGPISLRIAAMRSGSGLELLVEDDGVGLPAAGPDRTGIGVANCRSRLQELHGTGAGLDLEPRVEGGTRARIRLPAVKWTPSEKPQPNPS